MATRGVCMLAGRMADTVEVAAAADAAGFDAAWTSEFNDRSAIVALAAMAQNTTRCRVGSAIAYAVGRSPLVLANDARGLDELSGGRLVLGLGTGTKGMQIGWHGVSDPESPALRLEELVPLLRRIWRLHEAPVRHEGRFYSMNLAATADVLPPVRDQIPIFTAGVNRRMIETAGRVSDGLVCHPTFSSRYVHEVVRPAIAQGAERAGRDPAAVEIVGMLLCSVNDDEELARRELAAQLAFYAAPRAYAPMLEASGFAAEAQRIRQAFAGGDREAMIDAVSDEMLDAIGVAGTPEQVRAGISRREADFDHLSLYSPSFTMTLERVRQNTLDLIRVGSITEPVARLPGS
ncbi:MAG TPA: LLM class flavin-dependent oxidoreductase [Solirubrobacteraceae bacterium]|nr:LLM class flavin-dependent oxidoreductase [Solirubrobacteraceae bacterium]